MLQSHTYAFCSFIQNQTVVQLRQHPAVTERQNYRSQKIHRLTACVLLIGNLKGKIS